MWKKWLATHGNAIITNSCRSRTLTVGTEPGAGVEVPDGPEKKKNPQTQVQMTIYIHGDSKKETIR